VAFLSAEQIQAIGFKSVGKNVLISDKAVFYSPQNISIGENSRIDDFCILSAGKEITIGKYVHIACFATIIGKGRVLMKDYSGLSGRVSIYSSSDSYDGEWMTNPCLPKNVTDTKHKNVVIGKHVVVGSSSVVFPGVVLADGCAIGAMSLVIKSVLKPEVWAGVPIRKIADRSARVFELERFI
jgi:dTDP-4-amino-4,6-dideoxy-D-glucose acyltransferase